MASDYLIGNNVDLKEKIYLGRDLAIKGEIVLLARKPKKPHVRFGYIKKEIALSYKILMRSLSKLLKKSLI